MVAADGGKYGADGIFYDICRIQRPAQTSLQNDEITSFHFPEI